jgi:hypothetical protein
MRSARRSNFSCAATDVPCSCQATHAPVNASPTACAAAVIAMAELTVLLRGPLPRGAVEVWRNPAMQRQ